jgi:hypothetical protein
MLVHATGPAPVLVGGSVVRFAGDLLVLALAQDTDIPVGTRVILELPANAGAPRVIVAVEAVEGRTLTTRMVKVPPRDLREYPRLQGIVALRYRVAGDDGDAAAWLRGDVVHRPEHVPDPFMNFSATGLAFDDGPHAADHDLLLLEFSLPGDATQWRSTARVVRVWPIPIDERDDEQPASHRIAIVFETIPQGATAALTEYTMHIQEALLEGPGSRRNG